MIFKTNKIEMRFKKSDIIKKQIMDWGNISIHETETQLVVNVSEDSMFYNYFKTQPECILY